MEIIFGERGAGKTTELIKQSSKDWIYILVANRSRAEYLFKQARDMGIDIPFPATPHTDLHLVDKILIDEIEDVLHVLLDTSVIAVTTSSLTLSLVKDFSKSIGGGRNL